MRYAERGGNGGERSFRATFHHYGILLIVRELFDKKKIFSRNQQPVVNFWHIQVVSYNILIRWNVALRFHSSPNLMRMLYETTCIHLIDWLSGSHRQLCFQISLLTLFETLKLLSIWIYLFVYFIVNLGLKVYVYNRHFHWSPVSILGYNKMHPVNCFVNFCGYINMVHVCL